MAIGFRAAGSIAFRSSASTTPLTVTLPAGTALNDLMLMTVASWQSGSGGVAITTPSGWTLIDAKTGWNTDYASALYYRVAGSSESSASVTTGATSWLDAAIVGFTGVSTSTPIDATAVWAAATTSATITVPSITTVTANAWWITVGDDATTKCDASSVPSGWTQRFRLGGAVMQLLASTVPVVAAGATSATSYPRTAASGSHLELGIALRPQPTFTTWNGSSTVSLVDTVTTAGTATTPSIPLLALTPRTPGTLTLTPVTTPLTALTLTPR